MFVCRYVGISNNFSIFQVFFLGARLNISIFLGIYFLYSMEFGVNHWRICIGIVAKNQQNLQLLFLVKIPLLYNKFI